MSYNFFATISRMKYIQRWALMRNSRPENLSEHSLEVAMIAHALCTIGNVRYGRKLDGEKAALISLYHDASEIITGDMPTPVKYFNRDIRDAYKEVEEKAEDRLLSQLPDDLRPEYERIFRMDADGEERYMRELVKAADKISAMIKCIAEETSGNAEFRTAQKTIEAALAEMKVTHPEVRDFIDEFVEPYGNTLDELLS
jgi:5'-deoxynucleotidase